MKLILNKIGPYDSFSHFKFNIEIRKMRKWLPFHFFIFFKKRKNMNSNRFISSGMENEKKNTWAGMKRPFFLISQLKIKSCHHQFFLIFTQQNNSPPLLQKTDS